jgi:hypothetical protein
VHGQEVEPPNRCRDTLEQILDARGALVRDGQRDTLVSVTISIEPGPDGARTIDVALEPHGQVPAEESGDVSSQVWLGQRPAADQAHVGTA